MPLQPMGLTASVSSTTTLLRTDRAPGILPATISATVPTTAPVDRPRGGLGTLAFEGFRAVLLGRVESAALEFAGSDVAVRAIFAALVDARRPSIDLAGASFRMGEGTHRVVTAPLGDGLVSCVVLNERVVRGGMGGVAALEANATGTRAGRGRSGDTGHALVVHAARAVGPEGVPEGFPAVFHELIALPMERQWAPFLWKVGCGAGLITPALGEGSLRGYRLDTDATAWAPRMPVVLRAARVAAAGAPSMTTTR